MVTYKIHLIRHGMTAGNRDGRYVGRSDFPLCEEGVLEIQSLIKTFQYPEVQRVYTSPLTRCVETAELIYPNVPMVLVEDLMELSLGDFEGKHIKDLKDQPSYQAWLKDSLHNSPPNALETPAEFAGRITRGLNDVFMNMTQEHVQEAAVVAHGGVIMGLLSTFAFPKRDLREWAVSNGTGYSLSMSTGLWMRDKIVEVTGAVPKGGSFGGDRKVLESLGIEKNSD